MYLGISLAFRTKISIFSGIKEQLRWALQEQKGSSFNHYGSQMFPSQVINEEPSSRSISPEPTSSIADASAAAAQKKKQYETLTKEEPVKVLRVAEMDIWKGQTIWLTF